MQTWMSKIEKILPAPVSSKNKLKMKLKRNNSFLITKWKTFFLHSNRCDLRTDVDVRQCWRWRVTVSPNSVQTYDIQSERKKKIDKASGSFHIHKWIKSANKLFPNTVSFAMANTVQWTNAGHTRFHCTKQTNSIPHRVNLICAMSESTVATIEDVKPMWWVHNCTHSANHLRATGHTPYEHWTFAQQRPYVHNNNGRYSSERSSRIGNNAQTIFLRPMTQPAGRGVTM